MCDCYTATCLACPNKVEVHIADYSTERENVKVLCHECVQSGATLGLGQWKEPISNSAQVWVKIGGEMVDIGRIGENVLFRCTDQRGYGIHLN